MKKALAAAVVLLLAVLPYAAQAACPSTYTCGFSLGQAHAINGSGDSAEPQASIGTLSFDGSGTPTLSLLTNANGTVQAPVSLTGTCSSSATLGTLSFSAPGGSFKITFAQTAATPANVFFIGDTGGTTAEVSAGICNGATPLAGCPTTGSCQYTSAGAQPLGSANQGQPEVILGTIAFAASGSISFDGEINDNGTNKPISVANGTCSFDTTTKTATLDFTASGGPKIALVAAGSAGNYRAIGLGNAVTVGACIQ